MHLQSRQLRNHLVARWIAVGLNQFLVVLADVLRHIQLHLRDIFSLRILHIGIHLTHHVEHHIIITWVTVVMVLIPVAGLVMDLDIAHPQGTVDLDFGIKEVGTCIPVMQPRIDHFDVLAVGCHQFLQREQFMLPHIMK